MLETQTLKLHSRWEVLKAVCASGALLQVTDVCSAEDSGGAAALLLMSQTGGLLGMAVTAGVHLFIWLHRILDDDEAVPSVHRAFSNCGNEPAAYMARGI